MVTEERLEELKNLLFKKADLHIHSEESTDAYISIKEILASAKANSVNLVSITDHNTVDGVVNYVKNNCPKDKQNDMFVKDPKTGVYIVKGVEASTHYKFEDGHYVKAHINIYFDNTDKMKPLIDLIKRKSEAGKNYHHSIYKQIADDYNCPVSDDEIEKFIKNHYKYTKKKIDSAEIASFFQKKGLKTPKNELIKAINNIHRPEELCLMRLVWLKWQKN